MATEISKLNFEKIDPSSGFLKNLSNAPSIKSANGIKSTNSKSNFRVFPVPSVVKPPSKGMESSAPKPPATLPRFEALGEVVPPEDLPFEKLYSSIIDNGLDFQGPSLKNGNAPKVLVVGGGCAGLSAAFELKRAGANVVLLESSERVGGRIKTYGSSTFSSGLYAEGGAMRIPANNWLTLRYLKLFNMESKLERFEQTNRVVYLRALGKAMPYHEFEEALRAQDPVVLKLFPGLKESERGKTIDELWNAALSPIHKIFFRTYEKTKDVTASYAAVTSEFDQYTLKGYLEEIAGWSPDAIRLYSLGHAIVVLDNGILETWKDEFLCSPQAGAKAEMRSLRGGLETLTQAFTSQQTAYGRLDNDIRYGASVYALNLNINGSAANHDRITVKYHDQVGVSHTESGDFVVLAVPFTSLRVMEFTPAFDVWKADCILKLRYVGVTKVLLQFKKRWWEKWLVDNGMIPPEDSGSKGGGLVTDLAIRHAMFPNHQYDQFKDTERGVIMAAYTFQQDASTIASLSLSDVIRLAKRNLAQIVGDEKLIEDNFERGVVHAWSNDQAGGGSAFVFFGPGQKTQMYQDIIKGQWPVGNGTQQQYAVQFAGEHASFSHGWIQGAFESGIRVAHDIYESWVGAELSEGTGASKISVASKVK